jgi:hypothetical protein
MFKNGRRSADQSVNLRLNFYRLFMIVKSGQLFCFLRLCLNYAIIGLNCSNNTHAPGGSFVLSIQDKKLQT